MRLQATLMMAVTMLVSAGVADRALAWPPDLLPVGALPLKAAPRAAVPLAANPLTPCCAGAGLRDAVPEVGGGGVAANPVASWQGCLLKGAPRIRRSASIGF
ncbi:MAG: hypothetical protein PW843_03210 [Azospirillaceae bacterium]|nr:hypothetical protein [Azospirillaceae bacterium]